eukprot:TRINITY_DN24204_c0_g1_i2.p1 TRINITY_DN24204_c0_g1~~TRINITY_DN24204_c0_g1_i2.p1  ORF type:complete len:490 (+),score=54.85 TRINITY_DN24204_c0_g1_i2:54-1523(+)
MLSSLASCVRFLLLLHILAPIPSGASLDNIESRLRTKLFNGYDTNVRPLIDSTQPVDVKIGLALTHLLDFDIVAGVAKLNVWLRAAWYDPQLDWNSSSFGGLGQITADVKDIWTPDFLAYNHVERFEKEMRHDETRVYLYGDGKGVSWSRPAVVRIACSVDVVAFPFDEQTCNFRMGSWSMNGLLQDLNVLPFTRTVDAVKVTNGMIDFSDYEQHQEFELTTLPADRYIKYYACCPEPWPMIVFKLQLKRKAYHYVVNILVPTGVTTAMSMTTFAIPHESGERIGLGVTCMLVTTAIMFVSSDLLPVTDAATVVGTFYLGNFLFTLLALLETILTSALFQQRNDINDDGESGSFFVRHVLGISPQMAVLMSFRIDFYCAMVFPVAFACFCLAALTPTWSIAHKVGGIVGLVVADAIVIVLTFYALKYVRKALGYDVSHLSFNTVFWRFSRASRIGKRMTRTLSNLVAPQASEVTAPASEEPGRFSGIAL